MIRYEELGLVNTREMFKKALDGKYAIPAYNFNNMEQLQAIITACAETDSPVILQVSKGARAYANQILLRHMARGAVEMARLVVESIEEYSEDTIMNKLIPHIKPRRRVGVSTNFPDETIFTRTASYPEGVQVTLKVNSSPAEKGSRDVVVKPIADEANLYYFDWVQGNIKKVNKATNGKVGYVHVPDMGAHGLNEFVKYFYNFRY